jgi:hypothetical protein
MYAFTCPQKTLCCFIGREVRPPIRSRRRSRSPSHCVRRLLRPCSTSGGPTRPGFDPKTVVLVHTTAYPATFSQWPFHKRAVPVRLRPWGVRLAHQPAWQSLCPHPALGTSQNTVTTVTAGDLHDVDVQYDSERPLNSREMIKTDKITSSSWSSRKNQRYSRS